MVKNTLKVAAILVIFWIWLPTGPSDLLFIPYIVQTIGWDMYIVLSIAFVFIIYRWIEGKTLEDKYKTIRREIKLVA